MQKIILFYKFTPLKDPEVVKLWQKNLCESLGLRGRVIVATQGINGTLGGDIKDLKAYIRQTKLHPGLKDIVFKWSDGKREDFPRLSVKVRPELVAFNAADKIKVDSKGVVGGGQHLKPEQLHELMDKHNGEVVFVDGRNAWEASIGKFKNALVMDVEHSRDFPEAIADPKYDSLKDKPVVTYCTGGIRCEVLSKLMKDEGFKDVYQLDGGIVKYLEAYGDDGLWICSLFVFDERMSLNASDHTRIIGECTHCQNKTSNYVNCANKACNKLLLACESCAGDEFYCRICQPELVS